MARQLLDRLGQAGLPDGSPTSPEHKKIEHSRIGSRFTRYARMADSIFKSLGWPKAQRINLRRITKQKRQPGDHPALGDTYFRY